MSAPTTRISAPRSVDRYRPVLIFLRLASDCVEVDLLQLLGELTHLAVAHRPAVDLDDRRDLRAGSAKQQLVACVELRPVDAPLDHRHSQLVLDDPDQERACDALEDVVCYGW